MRNLKPTVATQWFAYTTDGVLHEGVTMPGEITTVGDTCEFEHGSDVAEKVAKYKDKLKEPTAQLPAHPGLFKHNDKVVKVDEKNCEGKKSSLEAVEAKEAELITPLCKIRAEPYTAT